MTEAAPDRADGEGSAKGLVRNFFFFKINYIAISNKKVSCSLKFLKSGARFTYEQG